ncbi:hypothetical protein OPT61_g7006 [Boeremia exigua]|uniref:Uncharacterized protein n=1 Tax=Boeremia exigua TaxID=749465 RepID=A0ACC2I412_9PLEO|nr:hypothetical protein OPT61_g7006 [Boeremia exigua]
MSEFIGSRISLISKSDIRYVGTLVEINSEDSTVSLDNVRSFGTEGRKGGKDEYPPSDVIYEQIVFRGSDVKDLRIEEQIKEKTPPAMPQDPAIIGVQQGQPRRDAPQDQQRQQQGPPNFPQQGQFPPGGYPPFGPGGPGGPGPYGRGFPPQGGFPGGPGPFPGGPGGFGMPPYGPPPPGWFPPGQGFNGPPGPFPPNMPMGPPGFQNQNQNQNQNQPPTGPRGAAPVGTPGKDEPTAAQPNVAEADGSAKPVEPKADAKQAGKAPAPAAAAQQAPPPPVESKPDVSAALAPPHTQPTQQGGAQKTPGGQKGGRIIPAVPIASPNVNKSAPRAQQQTSAPVKQAQQATAQQNNATQLATAAVAEAMAKLNMQNRGQTQAPVSDPTNNLAQKVEGMREREQHARQPRNPGQGAGFGGRGGRAGRGGRGGAHHQQQPQQQQPKMEVPTTDYDFDAANAKFNKQDMVKEAIATGSPLGETAPSTIDATANGQNGAAETADDVVIPAAAAYNKTSRVPCG